MKGDMCLFKGCVWREREIVESDDHEGMGDMLCEVGVPMRQSTYAWHSLEYGEAGKTSSPGAAST